MGFTHVVRASQKNIQNKHRNGNTPACARLILGITFGDPKKGIQYKQNALLCKATFLFSPES